MFRGGRNRRTGVRRGRRATADEPRRRRVYANGNGKGRRHLRAAKRCLFTLFFAPFISSYQAGFVVRLTPRPHCFRLRHRCGALASSTNITPPSIFFAALLYVKTARKDKPPGFGAGGTFLLSLPRNLPHTDGIFARWRILAACRGCVSVRFPGNRWALGRSTVANSRRLDGTRA